MSQLNDLGAAVLMFGAYLAISVPFTRIGGRLVATALTPRYRPALVASIPARYVRKPHLPHRPYAHRIDPTGPAGRHRLTIAKRVRRSTVRPVVPAAGQPAAGHVRWHGRPDAHTPNDVIAGIWSEANA